MGWKESEIDCKRKVGDRGKGGYKDINRLMGDRKCMCENVGGRER
jgi:hypothetical protein